MRLHERCFTTFKQGIGDQCNDFRNIQTGRKFAIIMTKEELNGNVPIGWHTLIDGIIAILYYF